MLIAGILLVCCGLGLGFVGGFGTVLLASAVWPLAGLIFLSGIVLIASSRIEAAIHASRAAVAIAPNEHAPVSVAVQASNDASSAATTKRKSFWAERRAGDTPLGHG